MEDGEDRTVCVVTLRVRNRIIGLEVGKSGGVFGAASKRMLETKVAPIEGTPSNMKVCMRDAEIDSQYC